MNNVLINAQELETINGQTSEDSFRKLTKKTTLKSALASFLGGVATIMVIMTMTTSSHAATASNTFQVTANISSSCIISGTTMNFGTGIDPIQAAVPLNASSSLSVKCSNTTPYVIALDAGANAGGATNFTTRKIKNGAYTLGYQLYTDSARTTVWGNGTGSSTTSGTGSGGTQAVAIYGQLPDLTGAVPGTYTDTVTVTITY